MNSNDELNHEVTRDDIDHLSLELAKLREEHEDLKATFQIFWRYFIEPAWQKIYEHDDSISELQPEAPESKRLYPGEEVEEPLVVEAGHELPKESPERRWREMPFKLAEGMTLEEIEKMYTLSELARHKGNKMATSRSLGLNIKTLYNKLNKWGVWEEASNLNGQRKGKESAGSIEKDRSGSEEKKGT